VGIVRSGEGGQGPPLGSRWLSNGSGRAQEHAEHHANQDEMAVSVQDLYLYYLSAFFARKSSI
jgi:hypothetical protein